MTAGLVALLGLGAAFVQVGMLARAARFESRARSPFIRFLAVAGALVLAAHLDCLEWGIAGWGVGFTAAVAILVRRWG